MTIDPRDAEIERLAAMVVEAEKYHGYHQYACLEIERLKQKLARHDAHEYEQRAWAAEARVEELTRAVRKALDHLKDTEDALSRDGIPFEISAALRDALTATEPAPDPRDAQITALREGAAFLLERLSEFSNECNLDDRDVSIWCGHVEPAMSRLRAVLAATEPAKESE